jgi:hypothetical protein
LLIGALTPITKTAIIELRKLLETYLRERKGYKFKLRIGTVTVEGDAGNVANYILLGQLQELFQKAMPPK